MAATSFAPGGPVAAAGSLSSGAVSSREAVAAYESLSGDRSFGAVQRGGQRRQGKNLAMRVLANGLDHNRYGYAISKKVGEAVIRNRIRRRVRAILRELEPGAGWDIVTSARVDAASVSYGELLEEARTLLASAGVPLATGRALKI